MTYESDYLELGLYENDEPVTLWVYGKDSKLLTVLKSVSGEGTRYAGKWSIPCKTPLGEDATAIFPADLVSWFMVVHPKTAAAVSADTEDEHDV